MNDNTHKLFVASRFVGDVVNGVFQKSIKGSRHILRTPRALCLSVESLQQAQRFGAVRIEILDTETGATYSCTIEHFMRYSFELQRGGWELQRALILERWDITSPLHITSQAPKAGEIKHKPGNGKHIRNPRGAVIKSPRQLMFKGMMK